MPAREPRNERPREGRPRRNRGVRGRDFRPESPTSQGGIDARSQPLPADELAPSTRPASLDAGPPQVAADATEAPPSISRAGRILAFIDEKEAEVGLDVPGVEPAQSPPTGTPGGEGRPRFESPPPPPPAERPERPRFVAPADLGAGTEPASAEGDSQVSEARSVEPTEIQPTPPVVPNLGGMTAEEITAGDAAIQIATQLAEIRDGKRDALAFAGTDFSKAAALEGAIAGNTDAVTGVQFAGFKDGVAIYTVDLSPEFTASAPPEQVPNPGEVLANILRGNPDLRDPGHQWTDPERAILAEAVAPSISRLVEGLPDGTISYEFSLGPDTGNLPREVERIVAREMRQALANTRRVDNFGSTIRDEHGLGVEVSLIPKVWGALLTVRDEMIGRFRTITTGELTRMTGVEDSDVALASIASSINNSGELGTVAPGIVGELLGSLMPGLRTELMSQLSPDRRREAQRCLDANNEDISQTVEILSETVAALRAGEIINPNELISGVLLLSSPQARERQDVNDLITDAREAVRQSSPDARFALMESLIVAFQQIDHAIDINDSSTLMANAIVLTNLNNFLGLSDLSVRREGREVIIPGVFPELNAHFSELYAMRSNGAPSGPEGAGLFSYDGQVTVLEQIAPRINAEAGGTRRTSEPEVDPVDRLEDALEEHDSLRGSARSRHRGAINQLIRAANIRPEDADILFENIAPGDDAEQNAVLRGFYAYIWKSPDNNDPFIMAWRQDPDCIANRPKSGLAAVGGAIAGGLSRLAGLRRKSGEAASQPVATVSPEEDDSEPPAVLPGAEPIESGAEDLGGMPRPESPDELADYNQMRRRPELIRGRAALREWFESLDSIEGTDEERRRAIGESWRQFSNFTSADYERVVDDLAFQIMHNNFTPRQARWLLGRMGLSAEDTGQAVVRLYEEAQKRTYATHRMIGGESRPVFLDWNRQARIWEDDDRYMDWLVDHEATNGNSQTVEGLRQENANARASILVQGFDRLVARESPSMANLVNELTTEMLRGGINQPVSADDPMFNAITNPANRDAIVAQFNQMLEETRGSASTVEAPELTPAQIANSVGGQLTELLTRDDDLRPVLDLIYTETQNILSDRPRRQDLARAWFQGPFIDLIAGQFDQGNTENVRDLLRIAGTLNLKGRVPEMAEDLELIEDQIRGEGSNLA